MQVKISFPRIRQIEGSKGEAFLLLETSADWALRMSKTSGADFDRHPGSQLTDHSLSENKDLKSEDCRGRHAGTKSPIAADATADAGWQPTSHSLTSSTASGKVTVGNGADVVGAWAVALKTVLMFALLLGIAVPQLEAARHPALDPNTDSAKCITCHADKTSAKSAHAKGSVNCLSCHEVRVNKEITRVKLITATPAALCFTCHKEKNPATITGRIHPPDAHDCLKCHDPHKSDNSALLLKPMSGDQAHNLCLDCHDVGVHVAKGGSRHPALDSGCDTCHIIHKSGDPQQREFAYHLTKDAPGAVHRLP